MDLETSMVEFVKARRIQPDPRALFISSIALIAIIDTLGLWGFKTPAILFIFAGETKKIIGVATCDWVIQMSGARFCSVA